MRAGMRAAGIAALLATGVVPVGLAQDVGGRYVVKGSSPDGSTYTGTAEIVPSGDSCRMSWNVGGEVWRGICMLSHKSFAATYRNGDTYGLVIYEVQSDGALKGVWTVADQTGIGTEVLFPDR